MKTYRLINDTGMGLGTKVINPETREEIKGIRAIAIDPIEVDKPITMTVEIFCQGIQIEGKLQIGVVHPVSGKVKRVKRIEFEDGDVYEC